MKFRGKIVDLNLIQLLSRCINTISKQSKEFILRLTKKHVYLISNKETGLDSMRLWCEIPADYLFAEYLLEGVSEEINEIYLSVSGETFHRSFKLINQNTKSVKLKLSKNNDGSCIQIVIEQPKLGSTTFNVTNDIPVSLVSRKHWDEYEEIALPDVDVTFQLPSLHFLKQMVDKMKAISPYLDIKIEDNTLFCIVSNESSEIEIAQEVVTEKDVNFTLEDSLIIIDIRRLSSYLNTLNVNPSVKVEAKLIRERLLHLSIVQDQVLLYFVLPHCIIN